MSGQVGASMIRALGAVLLALAAAPLAAQEAPPLTVQAARAGLAGEWRAELQYRDYQSGEWIGIPFTATIALAGDGVTLVRTSAYDDGPARGTVWITNVAMLANDGATEYTATFRADRAAESGKYRLALTAAADPTHWTLVAETDATDDDRPARLRETTVRDGDTVTTLKEVDFTDDDKAEWLSRNRTVLRRK